MSMIRRAFEIARETRAADPRLPWGDSTPPPPSLVGSNAAGIPVTQQVTEGIAAVYGCCSLIADSVASLPLELRTGPKRAGSSLVPLSPLLDQPYAEISRRDWWVSFIWALALRGNFYGLIIQRDDDGYPVQIKPIHNDAVQVWRDRATGALQYRFYGTSVPLKDVFHVRYQSTPGNVIGLNPIQSLALTFGNALARERFAESFFLNGANPMGVIQVPGYLDRVETRKMMRAWVAAHQGLNAANLPAILTEGAEFKPITINPLDAQLLEALGYSESQICGRIFRVPPHMLGITDKVTCVTGDTPVFTEHGPVKARDVRVGTRVWSLDEGTSGFKLADVVGVARTGTDPILNIATVGRTLRVNAKHRVLVRRKSPDPQPGVGGYRKVKWTNDWVRAGDLRVGDLLVAAHGLPQSTKRIAPNGRRLTEGFMAVAGLLIGDGNVIANGRGEPAVVCFARHQLSRYMPVYREFLRQEFKASVKGGTLTYQDRGTVPIKLREAERQTVFTSRRAAQELSDLGFSGVAHTKRVPGWVFDLAPELQLAFVRGYADADGHVTEDGAIEIVSVNPDLLQDVRHLLIGCGIPVGGLQQWAPTPPNELVQPVVSNPMSCIGCYDARSNLAVGSHDPRDQERLENGAARQWKRRRQYAGGSVASSPLTDFALEGAELHRVRSITVSDPEPVYDLSVAGTHTFLADGLVVHNSWGTGIEQQERGFFTNTLVGYLQIGRETMTALHPPGEFVHFDTSSRERGILKDRAQSAALLLTGGAARADDVRDWFDWAPLPGGDGKQPFMPINSQLLEAAIFALQQAKNPPAPPPAATTAGSERPPAEVPTTPAQAAARGNGHTMTTEQAWHIVEQAVEQARRAEKVNGLVQDFGDE